VELEWSLAGLWAVGLFASHELASQDIPLHRLSIAQSLQAFRRTARDYLHPLHPKLRLQHMLRQALLDEYDRQDKTSREYPRKKQERPAGKPIIQQATKTQILRARRIKQAEKG
jgi:hypothetical protein